MNRPQYVMPVLLSPKYFKFFIPYFSLVQFTLISILKLVRAFHHAVFVEARCRTHMSGCPPPNYELCRYPRRFPFHPPSPSEQSLSLSHLSLDMSGLPSYWRCTCVHMHAFHITHDRNQQQAFLGDPSLRRCQ